MKFAVDVGFSAVKALDGERIIFPSVVGTPMPRRTFGIGSRDGMIISVNGSKPTPIGETAMLQSTHVSGRRDASWVLGDEWLLLFCASLTKVVRAQQGGVGIDLVTGLPVADWNEYAKPLTERLAGNAFNIQHGDREFTVDVNRVLVVTQPYGSLAARALAENGDVLDNDYSTGMVGVVDIGGNTINLLAIKGMNEIPRMTTSDEFGLLHTLDEVRDDIRNQFKRFTPSTHEVSEWLGLGKFRYHGEWHDISPFSQPHLEPLLEIVVSKINDTWPESGRFDRILLTGGGSAALGRYIKARLRNDFANVDIQQDPRWTNVEGYFKLAQRVF